MGKIHITFRHTDKVTGLISGNRNRQRIAVSHSHVLTGKTDQASGHIQWILSRFQHTRQPVNSSIRIGISHGLVKR